MGFSLKMSAHAERRWRSRRISLSKLQIQRLDKALEYLEQKGARESLILLDDVALVVAVSNHTVITIVGQAVDAW